MTHRWSCPVSVPIAHFVKRILSTKIKSWLDTLLQQTSLALLLLLLLLPHRCRRVPPFSVCILCFILYFFSLPRRRRRRCRRRLLKRQKKRINVVFASRTTRVNSCTSVHVNAMIVAATSVHVKTYLVKMASRKTNSRLFKTISRIRYQCLANALVAMMEILIVLLTMTCTLFFALAPIALVVVGCVACASTPMMLTVG